MRNIIVITVFLLSGFSSFCQKGVNFENLTFDEALAKAKVENKLVFVDCYTSWCGPCRFMADSIFPQEKAGEFFNSRFVCVKFDMEKGEGRELYNEFGVKAFPTFLIVRPDRTMQHKLAGGGSLELFIDRVSKGLKLKTSFSFLAERHAKGKLNKKQLMVYLEILNGANERERAAEVREELDVVLTLKDRTTKEYWPILVRSAYGSRDFREVLNHIDLFRTKIGKERIDSYLYNTFKTGIQKTRNYSAQEPLKTLEQIHDELTGLDLPGKDRLLFMIDFYQACLKPDVGKVVSFVNDIESLERIDFWDLWNAFTTFGHKVSRDELAKILVLEDKFMNLSPENGKIYVEIYFEKLYVNTLSGVYFQNLNYKDALDKAKRNKRKLFIDCYTKTCMPCKYMEKEVFTQEKVGNLLNDKFICLKYDMEEGDGPELCKQFGITAFPTFLILTPEGEIWHKFVGGCGAESFMERVQVSFDDNRALGGLQATYKGGNRDKAFLLKYIKTLVDYGEPKMIELAKGITKDLFALSTDEEKVSKDYWFIFNDRRLCLKDSAFEKYLMANRDRFHKTIGREQVDERLGKDISDEIVRIVMFFCSGKQADATLDAIEKKIKVMNLSNEKALLALLAIAKTVKTNNLDKILTVCEKELIYTGTDASLLVFFMDRLFLKANNVQKARWEKAKVEIGC